MKNKLRENKGITLIALVITIIVLLILAGVAISMLSGENGILQQAAKAKTDTEEKSKKEQVELAVAGAMINTSHKVNEEDLKTELEKYGLTIDEANSTDGNWKVNANGTTYTIDSDGHITIPTVVETGKVATSIPVEDYGAVVINYEAPDSKYKDEGIKWRILLEDGSNIYLIASDYVQPEKMPSKDGAVVSVGTDFPRGVAFTDILSKYNGSSDIVKNPKLPKKYNEWVNLEANKKMKTRV